MGAGSDATPCQAPSTASARPLLRQQIAQRRLQSRETELVPSLQQPLWQHARALQHELRHFAQHQAHGERYKQENLPHGSQPIVNFVNAILGREEVQSKPEDGLRVIAFTEAAWQSAAQGGVPVRIAQLEE